MVLFNLLINLTSFKCETASSLHLSRPQRLSQLTVEFIKEYPCAYMIKLELNWRNLPLVILKSWPQDIDIIRIPIQTVIEEPTQVLATIVSTRSLLCTQTIPSVLSDGRVTLQKEDGTPFALASAWPTSHLQAFSGAKFAIRAVNDYSWICCQF